MTTQSETPPQSPYKLQDRLAHVIPALSYLFLGFLYFQMWRGRTVFEWATHQELFILFKMEMFALCGLGFIFVFSPLLLKHSMRGALLTVAMVAGILYAGHSMGGWMGMGFLLYSILIQFISARHQVLSLIQTGFFHMVGYFYVVILVRIFTKARGFEDLTADNIILPALVYFLTRALGEILLVFAPAHWKGRKWVQTPVELK
ncbi:hypothetical protein QPK87_15745 [Kamptonema cortianum]|nr:hypothetical protein [Oscillatoria laete-virens]MDK3158012.1 hypothetical protein [Kamptonema cortianum]MDL5048218.1 hypothetical protein [Oscillatoria amoena NRMC-F 0135]MDL5053111.1 hypothetical protein [Oscillatoria laete-virens NRMC-F 0139]